MVLDYAFCSVNVAALRRRPEHRSEMVSQLLFGERLELLAVEGDYWAHVRSFSDEYEGFCLLHQLQTVSKKAFQKAPKYYSLGGRMSGDAVNMPLPPGALLRSNIRLDSKAAFKGKKLLREGLLPEAERIAATAKMYLSAPYLWGGKEPNGIDCSGLAQMVFRLNGISIMRDASQQAKQGKTVGFLQEARCGDLAFFGNAEGSINHVGILLDEHSIIHATETAGRVVIDKIDQEGIVSKLLRKRTHSLRLIKRYF